MARRGENIFKRKDGRWEARVAENRGGKRYYRSLYGKNYSEVKAKRKEYYALHPYDMEPDTKGTAKFSFIAFEWLESVRGTVKESSFTRYHRTVYSYLVPSIGNNEVSKIDVSVVNDLREFLLTGGGKDGGRLSEKTVSDILSVFKSILIYAAGQGYPTVNTALIRTPSKVKKAVSILPSKDVERLEELLLADDRSLSVGILLTLHTGIRNGELCGLRWGDFDFGSQTMCISRTVERITDLEAGKGRTKVVVSEPKTEHSHREIPIPSVLCRYLQARSGMPDTYLLTGTDKPCEPHTLYVRYERFLRRNGFSGYTFHALRHTFATSGIATGFDAKALSEVLGHADVTTTLRCYVHPSPEYKRSQMEALFGGVIRGQKYGQ